MGWWSNWFGEESTQPDWQAIKEVAERHPEAGVITEDLWRTDYVRTPVLPDYFSGLFTTPYSGPNLVEINKVAAKNPEVAARINAAASKPAPYVPGFYEKLFGNIGRTVSGAFSGLTSGIQAATMPLAIGLLVLGGIVLAVYLMGRR